MRLVRPAERGPTTSDNGPRGTPPPSRTFKGVTPDAATLYSSLVPAGSTPGNDDVSVRSSLRARRSVSRLARARALMFRLMFAFSRKYTAGHEPDQVR